MVMEETSSAESMLTKLIISQKNNNRLGDYSLAVEYKLFFNEYYRNEYERNKMIIAKYDERKKGLIQDKGIGTDFDKSILYEAFDTVYFENFKLSDEIRLELLRGRMSQHLILKVSIDEGKIK